MLDRPAAVRLHPLHRLWRLLPKQVRRRTLARATALIAPRPDRTPPPARHGLAVGGELSRASGLGEGARLMLRGAATLGLPGWSLDIGAPLDGSTAPERAAAAWTATEPVAPKRAAPERAASENAVLAHATNVATSRGETPPAGAPLVLHINPPLLPLAMLRLGREVLRGRRIIGYWAWELQTVPPAWRVGLPFVHEVWVPSRFTADALGKLAPGRVRVVPHPVALAAPTAEPDRIGFGLPPDAVTVLVSFNMASSFERKNPLAAIAAFRAAFGDRDDRLLVIKVGFPEHFPADIARLRDAVGGARNIRLDIGTLSPHRSRSLTASADIVLSLHRSEGFGLVPAEAMLLGKPVIATGWSGNMDFMDADCAVPVGYRLVPVRDPRGVYDIPGAVWAEADLGETVEQLRRLADDPTRRAALGLRARAAAMARLTTAPLADALRGIGLSLPCPSVCPPRVASREDKLSCPPA
jgi:glycosyltransferase involved in cell wall biosynthesis